jgi:hypothetical protein
LLRFARQNAPVTIALLPRLITSLRHLLGATRRQLLFALNIYALIYALHCVAPVVIEGRVLFLVLPRIRWEVALDLMYALNLLLWFGSWYLASVLAARMLPASRLGNGTMLAVFLAGMLGTLGALREFVFHMREWNYSPHLMLAQMRFSERLYELVFYQASSSSFRAWMALFGGLLPLLALIALIVIIIGATRMITYFADSDEIDPARLSGKNTR